MPHYRAVKERYGHLWDVKKRNRQNEERGEIQVKSIIAKVMIACGGLIAVFGGMGLNSEGDAGFILAFKITAVGLINRRCRNKF